MNKIFTKSTLVLLLIAGGITTVSAQGPQVFQKIGKNPYELDASAVLEIASDNKGFLLTPLDDAQVHAIKTPAEGLVVYNGSEGLQVNTGDAKNPKWSTAMPTKAMPRTLTTPGEYNYTLNDTDTTVWVDATSPPTPPITTVTLHLPAPKSDNVGKTYIVGKIDDSSNTVTFDPPLQLNNSASGTSISTLNYSKSFRIQSNGISWYVID